MTGWIVMLILAIFVIVLCLLRLGVHLKYDDTLLLRILIGPVSVTVLPKKEKSDRKKPAKTKEAAAGGEDKKKPSFSRPNKKQILYTLETLPGILKKALRRFGKGITVSPLFLKVVFAGEDPADTAENYGKVQALVSALYPELKKLIRIKKTKIALSADYQREEMELAAELGISLRLGTLLFIAFSAGFALLKWFLGYRKLAENEASTDKTTKKRHQAEAA